MPRDAARGAEAARRPSVAFTLVLMVLAATLAYVGLAGVAQGMRAARGEGVQGTFTADDLSCVRHPGHTSCVCAGTFAANDGGPARNVDLHAAGPATCRVGEPVPATDAGASSRVYGPDGSREWLFGAALVAVSLAVPATQALLWARWARGRRRGPIR
ncbi:hypothetical protein [Nocardiopsis sp. NPDC006938]|uniref:hypothetical protein n=1 Tax=Nocardiopsis sp. NPDC006938 TaxID=3364337 RepID=UPI0036C2FFED